MKDLQSASYLEMRMDSDGDDPVFLRIPTFWNEENQHWIYVLRLPKSKKLLTGIGKNSLELQNACNKDLKSLFESEFADELIKMFKPACFGKK